MPCRDDRDFEHTVCDQCPRLKAQLDKTTQFLCYMVGEATMAGIPLPGRILNWATDHTKADIARMTRKMFTYLASNMNVDAAVEHFAQQAREEHPLSMFHMKMFRDIAEECKTKLLTKRAERDAKETAYDRAVAKLTKDDRRAIGLD